MIAACPAFPAGISATTSRALDRQPLLIVENPFGARVPSPDNLKSFSQAILVTLQFSAPIGSLSLDRSN